MAYARAKSNMYRVLAPVLCKTYTLRFSNSNFILTIISLTYLLLTIYNGMLLHLSTLTAMYTWNAFACVHTWDMENSSHRVNPYNPGNIHLTNARCPLLNSTSEVSCVMSGAQSTNHKIC